MIQIQHKAQPFVTEREVELHIPMVQAAHTLIHEGTGAGNDYLGWVHLASQFPQEELQQILASGARIREQATLLVVIGIGGSYLGARAGLQFLQPTFAEWETRPGVPRIVFAGHQMSASYMADLLELLDRHEVAVNVISKSGTTTEPALAFRTLQAYLEKRYGEAEAAKRIYATTDRARGALLGLAKEKGYQTFVIPDDVGGRYSVLTPVGLLPFAAAGIDVKALLAGAAEGEAQYGQADLATNTAYQYAVLRHILHQKGKSAEMIVGYEPSLFFFAEWWKQLFGESEGKDNKSLLPVSAMFSTDLHSLGQFIQEGSRVLFETVLHVGSPRRSLTVGTIPGDIDGLNYLSGRTWQSVNDTALTATRLAHTEGGVPNIVLEVPDMTEKSLGNLFYFFEKACALSGYLLSVNPFDQPGVEAYKKNMFALLGKPGYEALAAELSAKGATRS